MKKLKKPQISGITKIMIPCNLPAAKNPPIYEILN